MIVNGLFGEDTYCLVIHPFLSSLLGKLAKVFSSSDVFACATELFILISIVWISYVLSVKERSAANKLLVLMFCIYITLVLRIWSVNFLIQAAFIGFAGALGLFRTERFKRKWIPSTLAALLLGMAMMLRSSVGLMFIPFIVLGLMGRILYAKDKKEKLSEILRTAAPFLAVYLILIASSEIFYSREPYKSGQSFNDARVIVEDYPMYEWEEIADRAEGFTETEYKAAVMWMLMDTETLNEERLRRIGEAGSKIEDILAIKNIGTSLREMGGTIRNNGYHFVIFIILPGLLFVYLLYRGDGYISKLTALAAVLGAIVILIYFTMKGRAPLRVWYTAIFAMSAVLLSVSIVPPTPEQEKLIVGFKGAAMIALFVGLIEPMLGLEFHRFASPLNGRVGADETVFSETYRDNILCIWGGWDASDEGDGSLRISNYLGGWYGNVSQHFIYQCKLPSKEFMEHNIPIGEWFYGWPCMNEHLKSLNAENPARALVERDDVFYINGNGYEPFNDYLKAYMDEHFGEVTLVDAGVVGESPIYKLFLVQ